MAVDALELGNLGVRRESEPAKSRSDGITFNRKLNANVIPISAGFFRRWNRAAVVPLNLGRSRVDVSTQRTDPLGVKIEVKRGDATGSHSDHERRPAPVFEIE